MRRQDFFYELPNELIARQPTEERRGSRLLRLDGEARAAQEELFARDLAAVKERLVEAAS